MQTIDPIKPHRRKLVDIGPPPAPRASVGRSMDGMVGGRAASRHVGVVGGSVMTFSAHPVRKPVGMAGHDFAGALKPRVTPGSIAAPNTGRLAATASQVSLQQTAGATKSPAKIKKIKQKRARPTWLAGVLFGLCVLVLGALGIFPEVGQGVILVAAVIGIIRKVESRWVFALALATLVLIPICQVLGVSYLANSYAIFAYLLLFSGTVSLAFELTRSRRHKLSTVTGKKA